MVINNSGYFKITIIRKKTGSALNPVDMVKH